MAYELIVKGREDIVVGFACEQCRIACMPRMSYGDLGYDEHLVSLRAEAEACCKEECAECGKPREQKYMSLCMNCRHQKAAIGARERENTILAKAPRVAYADYKREYLFWEDEYYPGIEELWEAFEYGREPTEAWGCYELEFHIDADRLLEDALQEHHEDAMDDISAASILQLQKYLDRWCKKAHVITYMKDDFLVVLPPRPSESE